MMASLFNSRSPFYQHLKYTSTGTTASYAGIAVKSVFLWVLCGIGVYLETKLPQSNQQLILLVSCGICLVTPIIIYLVPTIAVVAAPLYALSQGVLLATVIFGYATNYAVDIVMAVGLTALVFIIMLVLYQGKVIVPNQRLASVTKGLFMALAAGGLIVFISQYYAPEILTWLTAHPWLTMVIAVGSALLACIRLTYEFEYINSIVSRKAEKKYEWVAAYGLFMTVIMLFFRLLQLLTKRRRYHY